MCCERAGVYAPKHLLREKCRTALCVEFACGKHWCDRKFVFPAVGKMWIHYCSCFKQTNKVLHSAELRMCARESL